MAHREESRIFAAGLLLASVTTCGHAPGSYAQIRGIRMYYETHGHGPALVLLHGGGGNGDQFKHQVPAFESSFEIIVPDLCSQGRTEDRAEPLTYHAMAEDVDALLDRLHVDAADVVGWSDGGIVGLDLALHHPQRVRHLVTFGANFTADGLIASEIAWDDTATAASFGEGSRRAYAERAPDPAHYEIAMNKLLDLWRTQPSFTLEELATIRARTMICAGENDLVRREHTEQLARAIPGAKLWIVPHASHAVIVEQPDVVNRAVLEFLATDAP